MSARIDRANNVYQLERRSEPDERVTEEDVKDAGKLSRLLMRLLKDVATLKRRFWAEPIKFQDRTVVSGTPLRLTHKLGARVDYWVTQWKPATPGDPPAFDYSTDSTTNTLVLDVGNSGTVSFRVELAG